MAAEAPPAAASAAAPVPGHVFEEHVGEIQVRLQAPTLAGLFEEAARALAELVGGGGTAGAQGPAEAVTLSAPDREALLLAWLDELIFRGETRRRVYDEAVVADVDGRALHATLRGREIAAPGVAVKAATFHRLAIAQTPGGFTATVILDV